MKTLLSIGHGYSAQALTKILPSSWQVIATTRSQAKATQLENERIKVLVWPDADLTDAIDAATHVLTSVAPNQTGDPFLAAYGSTLAAGQFEWVGYLSTTGVYGDHKGAWVDETTALTPSTKRGQHRVTAEAAWQALGLPLHIFRLAGIYGPGRGPFAKIRAGTARRIIKKGQVFSRIHVDDIAAVLWASINQPRSGAIYNLCDDDPAPPEEVIAYAAKILGQPLPPAEDFDTAEMTDMARSFYSESKRVKNDLIKSELGVKLIFPDYKAGLSALLKDE